MTNISEIHGPGIPVDKLDAIFERFYQAREGDHTSGMGLGLYISRQIVELHGGKVEIRNRSQGGCAVRITLKSVVRP